MNFIHNILRLSNRFHVSAKELFETNIVSYYMRPTAHFHSSLFLMGIIYSFSNNFSWILGIILLISSVLVDLDIILTFFLKEKNHRFFIFHSLSIWVGLAVISLFLSIFITSFFDYFLYACIGAIWHLLLDLVDWGLPVLPHRKFDHLYFGILKEDNLNEQSELYFSKKYWSNKFIIFSETILFVFSFLGWFTVPTELAIGSACIGFLVYLYFIYEIVKLRKNKESI